MSLPSRPEPVNPIGRRPPDDGVDGQASGGFLAGRESDVATVRAFLESDRGARALVLAGDAGIGKTTLWETGVATARKSGMRVCSARASPAEARVSFAGLIDLLDGVDTRALHGVPAPQLRALEVTLFRAEPDGGHPGSGAIALGFLNALRALALQDPLLVAVDDVHWLDPPSAEVLAFAARRLEGSDVRFLLTRRSTGIVPLERALEPPPLLRLEVGPLSLGAIRRLLHERLGLSLPRHLLRRLVDSTLGNPLFALELGRTLVKDDLPAIGEDLPVPEAVEDLLGMRVAQLRLPARRLLLAIALRADLRTGELPEVADTAAVADAVEADLLRVDHDRVRPSHPLLAAAALARSPAAERRAVHLRLARAAADPELRARHLALATDRPDEALAATVAEAAAAAARRGAAEGAAELAGHALRLTPDGAPERIERLLALAEYLMVAGEPQRAIGLLADEIEGLPSGSVRARAHLLLAEESRFGVSHVDESWEHLERALAESERDPALRARVLARRARSMAVARVERIPEAEAWATEALPAARAAGPDVEREVLYALAWARSLHGREIDDLCERFRAVSEDTVQIFRSPGPLLAERCASRGDVGRARATLGELLARADERGETWSYVRLRLGLCELALRVGDWHEAARCLDEWEQSAHRSLLTAPAYQRCRALLAIGRGKADEAAPLAAEAVAGSRDQGLGWDLLEALRVAGIVALFEHEPERAAEALAAVWAHTEREGVRDPGVFPVAPDLVEALTGAGRLDEARAVTARLQDLASAQSHPWGLCTARRCDAVIRLASRYDPTAAATLDEAAARYGELGLRFDRARTLLLLGRAQRRHRKRAAARASLQTAAVAFGELGSDGWSEQARVELERVGARRPRSAGELTAAEQRTAELAADGLSNKEIASTLYVSVHTVETHLTHVYAKLGLRSRAQLARHLAAPR